MDELDMSMSGSPQTSLILGREVITWWKLGVMYMVRLSGKRVLIISIVECVPRADGAITRLDMFISVQACCRFSSCTIFGDILPINGDGGTLPVWTKPDIFMPRWVSFIMRRARAAALSDVPIISVLNVSWPFRMRRPALVVMTERGMYVITLSSPHSMAISS